MYLYLKFKSFKYLEIGSYELSLARIDNINNDTSSLTLKDIDECIAYFNDKEELHCYELKITKVLHSKSKYNLEFTVMQRLDDINQIVKSDLVRFAEDNNWESSFNNLPDLIIVNKKQFIDLKSGTAYYDLQVEINKKLGYLNSKAKYQEILDYFQPLTQKNHYGDYLNNSFAVYSIGKACQHFVKDNYDKRYNEIDFEIGRKYQALAYEFFVRAYELNSNNDNYFKDLTLSLYIETLNQFKDSSSEKLLIKNYNTVIAYLNILIDQEVDNFMYLNLKANLIYRIKLHPFKIKKYYSLENSKVNDDIVVKTTLETVINTFESNQNSEFKKLHLKEYNIATNNLITYYLEKNDLNFIDYFLAKLVKKEFVLKCPYLFKENILIAKSLLEKAFSLNTNLDIRTIDSINDIPLNLIDRATSNMIFKYAQINTSLYMLEILDNNKLTDFDIENRILKYLTIDKKIGETKFIKRINYRYRIFEGEESVYHQQQITELKTICYLLSEKYNTALATVLKKDIPYNPTVLILALLFIGDKESLTKAETKLSIVKQKGYFKKYQLLEVLAVYVYSLKQNTNDFWQLNHQFTDNHDEIILGYYRTLNINFVANKKPILN